MQEVFLHRKAMWPGKSGLWMVISCAQYKTGAFPREGISARG
jgi:hypothetical protein